MQVISIRQLVVHEHRHFQQSAHNTEMYESEAQALLQEPLQSTVCVATGTKSHSDVTAGA